MFQCVNHLAVETGKKVKSHHTKRTAAFVHACAAFSYITIPSVSSEITRLRLYLVTAQIALYNQSLGQGILLSLLLFATKIMAYIVLFLMY